MGASSLVKWKGPRKKHSILTLESLKIIIIYIMWGSTHFEHPVNTGTYKHIIRVLLPNVATITYPNKYPH